MIGVYELLPPGGLDQSIVLAVLVGVWVTLLFTETLGWVFVGLVVPGYLASVLVVQPGTAAIIVAEALATFWLARALAHGLAPTRVWQPFFGRDRFFLIVVASVIIRQHDQLWLLPALSGWAEAQLGVTLPPAREFYSIGLVLVPLTANLMWKPGALRGLAQLSVVTGLTYVVLTFGLLAHTNLSLSSFELLYEDTAVDFLGNAKSYVLLLTTAAVAARFNLRYGWDFGGILLPALLGLLWFTPFELALTIGEALVLWAVVGGLLRWSPLRRFNLEGARKVALVFTVSVALKWLLSLGLGASLVGVRPRDLFGFGYLLSSLLAMRMLQRKSARQVLLPTLATALVGWVLGSLLGLGFGLVAPVSVVAPAGPQVMSQRLLRTPLGALALGRVQAEMAPPGSPRLGPGLREAHGLAWASLAAWNDGPTPARQEAAREAAGAADLVIAALPGEHGPRASFAVLGAERGFAGGQGLAVLWPGARGMVISVPSPVGEGPVAEAAAVLARAIDARAVLVAERDAAGGEDRHAWALARLAPAGYLELRADEGVARGLPVVHVERELPGHLDLQGLGWAPQREWSTPPRLRGEAWGEERRLVLRVHPHDLLALLASEAGPREVAPALLPWLGARERGPSLRPLAAAGPPSAAELVFLERRVAGPLVAGAEGDLLRVAGRMAGLVDHALWDIQSCGAGPCRALAEARRPAGAGWGLLVVGSRASGLVIEAPHAADEPGSGRLAAELWAASGGRALVIGGGGAGLGVHAPAQALHQAVAAEATMVLQIRGLGARAGGEELVIGLGRPRLDLGWMPPVLEDMLAPDGALGWVPAWRVADGSPERVALVGAGDPQLEFAATLVGSPVAALWFSPGQRRAYAPHDACGELTRLAQVGVVGSGCAPVDELSLRGLAVSGDMSAAETIGFAEALARVERYAESGDLHLLRGVMAAGQGLRAGLGASTGRGFIALEAGSRRALVWLGPANGGRARAQDLQTARRLLWQRARTLAIGEEEQR